MSSPTPRERFNRLFSEHQRSIYAHLFALLTNVPDVEEVFQATCVVLLDKADQFEPGTNFRAWAVKIAEFEAYNYRRRQRAERQRFSDEMVRMLADHRAAMADELSSRAAALRKCVQNLSQADQQLLQQKYAEGLTVKQLAERLGRSVEGLYKSIQRIRRSLRKCVDRRVAAEGREIP